MRKRVLAVALAGIALPALALAAQPIFIRVGSRTVPLREVVQVVRTAAGPVRVHTWRWRGPNGATMVQVSETRSAGAPMPAWVQAQFRALQAQMDQMQLIETALSQQMLPSLPVPVMFGRPMLLPLPGQGLPFEVRFLQPVIPLQAIPAPRRVIVLLPRVAVPQAAPPPVRHRGHLV
ncbi:MAG: hypothetical protein ACP5P4_00570 [Steroidobacteraceae bacterium]